MPHSATDAAQSRSGIQTRATGDSYIPSSTRADGSQRKEIRIRPGYRPPEDVEVYRNRTAEAWKNRGSGGIPGAEQVSEHGSSDAKSDSQNKNAKRREARKKATATKVTGSDAKVNATEDMNGASGRKEALELTEAAITMDEQAENEKKARNLKKKLKQARDLRQKKDKGEPLLPEQFTKVMKIHELIRELDLLGFDADGEMKQQNKTERLNDGSDEVSSKPGST